MLTLQLRELEADGVIMRHAYPQIPPMEYEISPFDQSLGPILLSLRKSGQHYGDSIEGTALQHQTPDVRPSNACAHT
jgi:DNA-binding HxlR family transcriptional regulator